MSDRRLDLSSEQAMARFHERLKEHGLKSTAQRDDIARVFFQLGRHISAEELYAEVKKVNPHVGYATIYRTLKLLKECELVYERHFDDASGALRDRHQAPSRPLHLRAMRQDYRVRESSVSSACSRSSRANSASRSPAIRWSFTGFAPIAATGGRPEADAGGDTLGRFEKTTSGKARPAVR